MRRIRWIALMGVGLAVGACQDDPLTSKTPDAPPPPTQGVQAFLQVDNDQAKPGDVVHVYVRVQFASGADTRLGSYTGRLHFDAATLGWQQDNPIDDGLRVTNPNGAPDGEIRFAGASAAGFGDLTLYQGTFQVKTAGWADGLALQMDELSAAQTLGNLRPALQVTPSIFLRSAAN